MLDIKTLDSMPLGTIFATGTVVDSPAGINKSGSNKELRWIAKVGDGIHDWCIYIYYVDYSIEEVARIGDKVYNYNNIKSLVPCTDEVFEKYRF